MNLDVKTRGIRRNPKKIRHENTVNLRYQISNSTCFLGKSSVQNHTFLVFSRLKLRPESHFSRVFTFGKNLQNEKWEIGPPLPHVKTREKWDFENEFTRKNTWELVFWTQVFTTKHVRNAIPFCKFNVFCRPKYLPELTFIRVFTCELISRMSILTCFHV